MTRKEAMESLLAEVEAGTATHKSFDWTSDKWPFGLPSTSCFQAYYGSLDAAKVLHEAVLPGWSCALNTNGDAQAVGPLGVRWYGCNMDNPARAWLIAILKALIAQEAE